MHDRGSALQALIDFIAGLIALLAAAALAQFGVDMNTDRSQDREVRRIVDCDPKPASTVLVGAPKQEC